MQSRDVRMGERLGRVIDTVAGGSLKRFAMQLNEAGPVRGASRRAHCRHE